MALRQRDSRATSPNRVLNDSTDDELKTLIIQPAGFDGQKLQRALADSMAVKVTVDGTNTYVGLARPGTAQSSALWQAFKVDTSSGTIITYADGNSDFDNSATDLTALSYS